MRSGQQFLLGLMLLGASGSDAWAEPSVDLEGEWRFSVGDDLSWAATSFDDESWDRMVVPESWAGTRYEAHWGFAWYRRRVEIPRALQGEPLGVLLPAAVHITEVYADGQRIGSRGQMPPNPRVHPSGAGVYAIPEAATQDGALVLALRVYRDPAFSFAEFGSGFKAPTSVPAELGLIRTMRGALAESLGTERNRFFVMASYTLFGVMCAFGLLHLLLFLGQRRRLEYLLLSGVCFCFSILPFSGARFSTTNDFEAAALQMDMISDLGNVCLLGFVVAVFQPPKWAARLGLAAGGGLLLYDGLVLLWRDALAFQTLTERPLSLFILVFIVGTGWAAWRRKDQDAGVFLLGLGLAAALMLVAPRDGRGGALFLDAGLVAMLLTMALVLSRRSGRQVRNLRAAHAASRRFVPADFLMLLGRGEVVDVERGDANQREMTVMFADVRGFTTRSEGQEPKETFAWLNRYLATVEPVIRDQSGFVNQYYGDGIMALFSSADDAVRAGLLMRQALARASDLGEHVELSVGLHTGSIVLGTIGGADRLDTGVVGDAVNTAARVESLTRVHEHNLLISDATMAALGNPAAFDFDRLETVTPKGKSQPLTLYAVAEARS